MSRRLRRVVACVGFIVLHWGPSSEAAERHVLVLQSAERGNLTIDYFTEDFRAAVDAAGSVSVTMTQFVVNPSGFAQIPEQAIVEYLRSAFANRPPPDLVMTVGGPAAAFARRFMHDVFPGSLLLFAAVDERFLQGAPLARHEAAVAVVNDMPGIVDDILQLLPETSTVFMVIGSGPLDRFWRQQLEIDFQRFGNRVNFIWPEGLSLAEILRDVAALPPNSAVFYLTFGADPANAAYSEARVLADIRAAANAPLFGSQGVLLGHGIVGGRLLLIDELGRIAADVALRLMKGESSATIRTPSQRPGGPVFDWRELQRWGITEARLPLGSVVRFRERGIWDRFKWTIIVGGSVVVAQALLIGALLISRAKRRRAEALLRQNVTALDTARGALSNLSRSLMEAQEQERTRIARELHDDVSQRMTFVAMGLAQLRGALPANATEAQELARSVQDTVVALGLDVQRMSHRMHSSKVELTGLSAAAESFCREVSSHHDVEIEYVQADVPGRLPEGVGISVFRVLQEALANALKHSGARHCRVTLRGSVDTLMLEIVDDGCGFDTAAGLQGHGLGLISMQERLKLVHGDFVIESKVGGGTTVRATVPLVPRPTTEAQPVSPDRARPSSTV
jgi:signal transduction histidine kinase